MIGLILLFLAIFFYFKREYQKSLILYFFLCSNGFQLIDRDIILIGLPGLKVSDLGLLFLFFIILKRLNVLISLSTRFSSVKFRLYFFVWLIFLIFYSVLFLDLAIFDVVIVSRNYLFLFSFILFYGMDEVEVMKVMKSLYKITLIQCGLFILQVVFDKTIMFSFDGGSDVHTSLLSNGYVRYYNMPQLLIPSIYYLFFFRRNFLTATFFRLELILLIITLVLPFHRTMMILVFSFLTVSYFLSRKKMSGKLVTLFFIVLAVTSFSGSNVFQERFSTLSDDLNLMNIKGGSYDSEMASATLSYRFAHFAERAKYSLSSPERFFFGAGLINDASEASKKLDFQFGILKKDGTGVAQIDTGDIVWSILIINFGVFGLILFVSLFIVDVRSLISNMMKLRTVKEDTKSNGKLLFVTVTFITLLLLSFTSIDLILPYFQSLLSMLLVVSVLMRDKMNLVKN